jgi:ABC-2 type transport system ATP-binding protein
MRREMLAVEARDLTKSFRFHQKEPGLAGSVKALFKREWQEKVAVDGVTFSVAPGEIVGFLGPNGAGKTTTLKMLCGLLYPTRGEARVLGHTPVRREHAFLRRISLVLGQRSNLWNDIPALELFLVQQDVYGLSDADFRRNIDELSEMLEIGHLLRVQVRKLSLGERMKMELLSALLHRPDVLFLDEPTIGLDLVSQQRVREFLAKLNRELGTTILLTSHYMGDIEALCPRVLVINHGRMFYDGSLAGLVEQAAPEKVITAVYGDAPSAEALAGLDRQHSDDPHRVVVRAPRARVADVADALLRAGVVVDLAIEEVPVEEIVRSLFAELRP